MLYRFLILVFLVFVFLAETARADDYIPATWPDLVHTLVRFNVLDLSDQAIMDDYAVITDCKLYQSFYQDDFKWNQVREAMRQSIALNVATYPMYYRYDVNLQLDRYDFKSGTFLFTHKATLHNVNTFVIYTVAGTSCTGTTIKIIPRSYRVVLPQPLEVEGLPLAQQDAQAMLKKMEENHNDDRIVYARFNLRIVYIEPLRKNNPSPQETSPPYTQSHARISSGIRLDARLDSIDFYGDAGRNNLIYHYQPD